VSQEDRNQYPILQFCVPSSYFKVFRAQLHSSLQVSRTRSSLEEHTDTQTGSWSSQTLEFEVKSLGCMSL